jgi:hypothetical protein
MPGIAIRPTSDFPMRVGIVNAMHNPTTTEADAPKAIEAEQRIAREIEKDIRDYG